MSSSNFPILQKKIDKLMEENEKRKKLLYPLKAKLNFNYRANSIQKDYNFKNSLKSIIKTLDEKAAEHANPEKTDESEKDPAEMEEESPNNFNPCTKKLKMFQYQIKNHIKLSRLRLPETNRKTPSYNYISFAQRLKTIPYPSGIINKNPESINFESFSLDDKHLIPITEAIKSDPLIKSFNLSNNRISGKGFDLLLKNLPYNISILNLSSNNLSRNSYEAIASIINDRSKTITELNLENNPGKDLGINILSDVLIDNNTLLSLNISNNGITDNGAAKFGRMIYKNSSLKILLFHWNKITGIGGEIIADAMSENNGILILDGSFNRMGKSSGNKSAFSFKKMFQFNKKLIHLDISSNSFDEEACVILSEGIRENHTIYGLHSLGNYGIVDPQGFFSSIRNLDISNFQVFSRIENDLTSGRKTNKVLMKMSAYSNCWICEGWSPVKFIFNPLLYDLQEYSKETSNICVHLSSENFKPDLMIPNAMDIHELVRMIPSGVQEYYFSIDGKRIETCNTDENSNVLNYSKNILEKIPVNNKIETKSTNYLKIIMQNKSIFSDEFILKLQCIPRPPPRTPRTKVKRKEKWSFPISIFRDYIADNEELLKNCFEFDWANTKVGKFIKDENELKQIKKEMRIHFKYIRDSYKYFAAIEPCGQIFSISTNVAIDLINKTGAVDQEGLKTADLGIEFIATNTKIDPKYKNNELCPDRFLVRHELMEYLIRIALRKYKGNEDATKLDSVRRFMANYFSKSYNDIDCHNWRLQNLWNEPCDIVLKKYLPLIKYLFKKYSGRYALPGKPKYVSLIEFQEMINSIGKAEEIFGSREIAIQYNLSMMTQIDEIEKDRHLKMNLDEFIEAISRVADKFKINSPYSNDSLNSLKANNPLNIKIQNLLETLLITNLKKEELESFEVQFNLKKASDINYNPELAFKAHRDNLT